MPTRRIQLRCMCLLLAWLYRGMVSVTTRISISRSVKSPAQADSSPPQAEPALQLNDAAADGDRHRLRAIVGVEFVHDVLDMDLDGLVRDEQLRGDIPVPVAR